jgi:hypothetical protein
MFRCLYIILRESLMMYAEVMKLIKSLNLYSRINVSTVLIY